MNTATNLAMIGQLSVEPVFGWYALLPLAVLMLASLWLTLTSTGISLGGRWALASLRLLAMLVLLLGWLRPAMISTSERESAGAIAVLMDDSQSMTLPSDVSNQSRWDIQHEVWSAIESSTKLRIGQTELVPYFYDGELSPAASDDLPSLERTFNKAPIGRLTDLGNALSKIGRTQLEPPLRGVMLMGDAVQTLLPPQVDPTVAARQMAQLDQPILLIGIGPRGENSQLKDVALEGMPEHFTAFVKKQLKVPLVVNVQGMQGIPITVELSLRASGKPDQQLESRKVLASKPSEKLAIEFNIVVPDEGEYLLEARATVAAREQSESNNLVTSFVTVREGGAKILYLEGQPRYEQTYLKRSLNESLDFDTDYRWFPEKERRSWPVDLSIDLQQYDAIVIGDLDAAALSNASLSAIAARVRRGAGILFLGGYHSFDAGGYGRSPLAPMFPIELSRRSQGWDGPIDRSFQITQDIPLRATRPHPITTLAPEPDNGRIWAELKPLQGMNRFGPLRSDPGVQVLLEGPQREPALVTGEFGNGRVLAFAGDTTWRWWLSGRAKIHQQFWRQSLLWLIRRDSLKEGFRLVLDRRRLLLDETPKLTIEWFGGSENKPMPEAVKIELSREGRWLQNLSSNLDSANLRSATLAGLDTPGLYRAALTANGSDGEAYQAEIAFVVRDESRELAQPAADWQMMANIVSANAPAGGRFVLPEDVGEAIEWLRERQEATKVKTIQKRGLGDAAWDAWLYLVVFCVLMSFEWGLRKSWQLP